MIDVELAKIKELYELCNNGVTRMERRTLLVEKSKELNRKLKKLEEEITKIRMDMNRGKGEKRRDNVMHKRPEDKELKNVVERVKLQNMERTDVVHTNIYQVSSEENKKLHPKIFTRILEKVYGQF